MNQTITAMLASNPTGRPLQADALAKCIEACFVCVQTCVACADACLAEEAVHKLRGCIRLNLDCADVCESTGKVLSRQHQFDDQFVALVLGVCAQACDKCGAECSSHASMHEHCGVCAAACKSCHEACMALRAVLSGGPQNG